MTYKNKREKKTSIQWDKSDSEWFMAGVVVMGIVAIIELVISF